MFVTAHLQNLNHPTRILIALFVFQFRKKFEWTLRLHRCTASNDETSELGHASKSENNFPMWIERKCICNFTFWIAIIISSCLPLHPSLYDFLMLQLKMKVFLLDLFFVCACLLVFHAVNPDSDLCDSSTHILCGVRENSVVLMEHTMWKSGNNECGACFPHRINFFQCFCRRRRIKPWKNENGSWSCSGGTRYFGWQLIVLWFPHTETTIESCHNTSCRFVASGCVILFIHSWKNYFRCQLRRRRRGNQNEKGEIKL